MKNTVFQTITSKIMSLQKELGRSIIVGINGVDTSGKTRFTESFSGFLTYNHIPNSIIHIDHFHNPSHIRNNPHDELNSYYLHAFNYEYLINQLLEPVRQQQSINLTLHHLNLKTDRYDHPQHYQIKQNSIILVEGILLYRPPLTRYFDFKIYLDITFEEEIRRAGIRDGKNMIYKYHEKYIPVQKRYINEFFPDKQADLVINNMNYRKPVITSFNN